MFDVTFNFGIVIIVIIFFYGNRHAFREGNGKLLLIMAYVVDCISMSLS